MSAARREPPPPHDIDAEKAALGAVLLTADALHYAHDRGLDQASFYAPGHQAAWHAIGASLARRPEVLTAAVVGNDAGLEGRLEDITTTTSDGHQVTGRRALSELEAAGSLVGFRADIDTVVAHSRRRRVMARTIEVLEAVRTGNDFAGHLADLTDLAGETSVADRYRSQLLVGQAITEVPPLEPLIEEVLDLDTLAGLYGPVGSGKSFVALDLALCVALGKAWNGHEVKTPRGVLYVMSEGYGDIYARYRAWCAQNDPWGAVNTPNVPDHFACLPTSVQLMSPEDADAIGRIARELRVGLVIFDTLARNMAGGDENSGKDMSAAIAGLDTVRRLSGACTLAVHHTGKDATRGLRGHSSLLGALDTAIEVKAAEHVVTLEAVKQKTRAGGTIGRATLKPAGPSLALEWGAASPVDFDWLADLIAEFDIGDGVPKSILVEASGKSPATVGRALAAAVRAGAVTRVRHGYYGIP